MADDLSVWRLPSSSYWGSCLAGVFSTTSRQDWGLISGKAMMCQVSTRERSANVKFVFDLAEHTFKVVTLRAISKDDFLVVDRVPADQAVGCFN